MGLKIKTKGKGRDRRKEKRISEMEGDEREGEVRHPEVDIYT